MLRLGRIRNARQTLFPRGCGCESAVRELIKFTHTHTKTPPKKTWSRVKELFKRRIQIPASSQKLFPALATEDNEVGNESYISIRQRSKKKNNNKPSQDFHLRAAVWYNKNQQQQSSAASRHGVILLQCHLSEG